MQHVRSFLITDSLSVHEMSQDDTEHDGADERQDYFKYGLEI